MATIGANALTLSDWAKRTDNSGKTTAIVELLSQTNEILQDIPFVESNMTAAHRITTRTGLPAVFWRIINQGVQTSKSTTAQLDEATAMLEAWSEVDTELARLGGDVSGFRASEAMPFVEAMNQEMAQTLFYGNSGTAPEEFTGLSIRYSSLSAGNASNIISGGGSGSDNTSIWLVGWGQPAVFGIFPKGSTAGLKHEDFGEETAETTAGVAGTRLRVFREMWQWKFGLALQDWRYVVRIPNIDVSNMVANAGAADLLTLMIKATYRLPSLASVKPIFYVNRSVAQYLDLQTRSNVSTGSGITYDNVQGKRILTFRGIPVRVVDQLLETEAAVT